MEFARVENSTRSKTGVGNVGMELLIQISAWKRYETTVVLMLKWYQIELHFVRTGFSCCCILLSICRQYTN